MKYLIATLYLSAILFNFPGYWILLKLFVLVLFSPIWAFMAYIKSQEIDIDAGEKLLRRYIMEPLELFAGIGSIVFNIFVATFIFKEMPKELFFTNRLKRILSLTKPVKCNYQNYYKALIWSRRLNSIHPNHV